MPQHSTQSPVAFPLWRSVRHAWAAMVYSPFVQAVVFSLLFWLVLIGILSL
jgi:hypothetical protein